MAKKLSLADKYALAKGNSSSSQAKGELTSRYKAGSSSRIDLSYRRKLPIERMTNSSRFSGTANRTQSIPGTFGSPIKALHSTPSKAKRPFSMYKILPYLPQKMEIKAKFSNKVQKDRLWLKRSILPELVQSKNAGVFGKLRGFLTGLKPPNDEFKRLSTSIKKELNIQPEDKSSVSFDEAFAPREKKADNLDFDEVDANVQLAKKSLEEQRLRKIQLELEEKVKQQDEKIRELTSEHERELYLTKASYEARIVELNERVSQLSEMAANTHREIENERLKELEKSVRKENESFLVYQKETVRMFEDMKLRLEEKEKELNKKEREIQEEARKSLFSSPKLFVTPKAEPSDPPSETVATTSHNTSFAEINIEHVNAMSALNKEHIKLETELKKTEKQFNHLLYLVNTLPEQLFLKDNLTESQWNSQILELRSELENTSGQTEKPANPYEEKLSALVSFLERFRVEFAEDKQKAYELYEPKKLQQTERKVKQLTKSVRKKQTKREDNIRELQYVVNLLLVDEKNYDFLTMKESINGLREITDLLRQQDVAVSTLKQLTTIQKKLEEIHLIVGDHK